jgi:hypothetical protein
MFSSRLMSPIDIQCKPGQLAPRLKQTPIKCHATGGLFFSRSFNEPASPCSHRVYGSCARLCAARGREHAADLGGWWWSRWLRAGRGNVNLFAWLRSRKEASHLVQADASALIARFGDGAYFEARDRAQRSAVIDGDRPGGHWTRVKIEIAN